MTKLTGTSRWLLDPRTPRHMISLDPIPIYHRCCAWRNLNCQNLIGWVLITSTKVSYQIYGHEIYFLQVSKMGVKRAGINQDDKGRASHEAQDIIPLNPHVSEDYIMDFPIGWLQNI
ncbi:hypothetical protein PanWU01x14_334230 [Parasponia andersonii]|uniref:Uncharacterized protein n=1 Tax=Parasponia andersonii TaxID=3476 RepID=A0A2P5AGM6_PARAD|nr:hypothetical protein PanWU01x14_334230 [Parasponia andersonii]